MFFDPIDEQVHDYVSGKEDLQARQIRAIGSPADRIAEDKLRMLRAIRFAARFDFAIESQTLEAILKTSHEIRIVSSERIAVEVQKTLATSRAAWALEQWNALGLLAHILPCVESAWTAAQDRILSLLATGAQMCWQTKLAAALYESLWRQDITRDEFATATKRAVTETKEHLKLSNLDARAIEFAIISQTTLENAQKLPWSQSQPTMIHEDYGFGFELLKMRIANQQASPEAAEWLEAKKQQPNLNPAPLLQGQDLIHAGMKPGPEFKDILQQAWLLQLDQELTSHDQAVEWLQTQLQS